MCSAYIINHHNNLMEVGTVIFILLIWKQRLRENTELAQGHTAVKWQRQDSSPEVELHVCAPYYCTRWSGRRNK